jgi:FSR family fosmidomycin resistance protein-like MFS transporter
MLRSAAATGSRERPAVAKGPRLATVIVAHPVVDAYAGFVAPLLAVLQVRCDLTAWQTASLLSLGSLISGLCQPFFAWLTDRIDSRLFGTAGVAVAAVALSSIGLARDFPTLIVFYTLGALGVGAFHPVAAASVGELSGRRRSVGVTLFFVAGMLGATAGPIISTRVTAIEPNGFDILRWLMIPGVAMAIALHLAIRDVPHRHHAHRELSFTPEERRWRWRTTLLLLVGNSMRYTVYMALLYLYVEWSKDFVAARDVAATESAVAAASSILCGELNAATMLGMGLGGLVVGMLVPAGREKLPLIVIPIVLAPTAALFPWSDRAWALVLALACGIGFAAVIPASISVAQRLLPHRTSLASSLMMGAAWAIAAIGPPLAEWSQSAFGLTTTFALVATLLAASGIVGLPVGSDLLRRAAGGGDRTA